MNTPAIHSIKKALGYSTGQLNNMLLDGGLDYLSIYLGPDPRSREILLSSSLFWNWWSKQWHKRCEHFARRNLKGSISPNERAQLRALFSILHDPQRLEIKPTRNITDMVQAVLTDELNENQNAKDQQAVRDSLHH